MDTTVLIVIIAVYVLLNLIPIIAIGALILMWISSLD